MKELNVVVNYPTTEEGWNELRESQANGLTTVLEQMLTPRQMKKFIALLEEEVKKS